MIDLVGLVQAKAHLRILDTNSDTDIAFKISQASEIVLDYIKRRTTPSEWVLDSSASPVTVEVPALIQAATLLVLGSLYEQRESEESEVLSEAVMNLLERYRDPTLS